MPKPPVKHKPAETWTPAEILEHKRTGREPLTAEWRSYITTVAEAAGLTPDDLGLDRNGSDKPIEDMTPRDHFERVKRTTT